MFTALLDTCVLWPSLQRDVLLSLAAEGMYRPIWSSAILAGLHYAETAKHVRNGDIQEVAEARAARLLIHMRRAFNDAEIRGWEGLEGTYGLPDPDDEHVLAAAVVAGAGVIVTGESEGLPRRPASHGHPDTHSRAVRRGYGLCRPAPRAGRHPEHRPSIRPQQPTTDRRRAARCTGDRVSLRRAVDLLRSATLEWWPLRPTSHAARRPGNLPKGRRHAMADAHLVGRWFEPTRMTRCSPHSAVAECISSQPPRPRATYRERL